MYEALGIIGVTIIQVSIVPKVHGRKKFNIVQRLGNIHVTQALSSALAINDTDFRVAVDQKSCIKWTHRQIKCLGCIDVCNENNGIEDLWTCPKWLHKYQDVSVGMRVHGAE